MLVSFTSTFFVYNTTTSKFSSVSTNRQIKIKKPECSTSWYVSFAKLTDSSTLTKKRKSKYFAHKCQNTKNTYLFENDSSTASKEAVDRHAKNVILRVSFSFISFYFN